MVNKTPIVWGLWVDGKEQYSCAIHRGTCMGPLRLSYSTWMGLAWIDGRHGGHRALKGWQQQKKKVESLTSGLRLMTTRAGARSRHQARTPTQHHPPYKIQARFAARKKSTQTNFLVWIPLGGVGVFHAKGWGSKSSFPPSKVCSFGAQAKQCFSPGCARNFARMAPPKS